MPTIRVETYIQAPPERCFDLSLNVDAHGGKPKPFSSRAI